MLWEELCSVIFKPGSEGIVSFGGELRIQEDWGWRVSCRVRSVNTEIEVTSIVKLTVGRERGERELSS